MGSWRRAGTAAVCAGLLLSGCAFRGPRAAGALSEMGLSSGMAADWREILHTRREGRTYTFWTLKAGGPARAVLRIEAVRGMAEESARAWARERMDMTLFLFQPFTVGYTGDVMQLAVAPEELQPVRAADGGEFPAYFLYATDRFAYGAVDARQVRYRALYSFLYCGKTRTVYSVELFYPVAAFRAEQAQADLRSFRCGDAQ